MFTKVGPLLSGYLYLIVLNSAKSSGKKQLEIWQILVSQELFERKFAIHFLLHYSRKGLFSKRFDPEHW